MSYETHALALDVLEDTQEERVAANWLNSTSPVSCIPARDTKEGLQLWKDGASQSEIVVIEGTITVSF